MYLSLSAKVEKEHWSLDPSRASIFFFYLLILFLPTQFGKHFWPTAAFINGLRIDYLSPTIYLTDIFIIFIFLFSGKQIIFKILKSHKEKLLVFLTFILFIILGIIFSKNIAAGIYGLIKLLEFSFLGVFIFINHKTISLNKILTILSVGIIFETALAVLQYFNIGSLEGLFYFLGERKFNSATPGIANASIAGELILRPYGTFSHPNLLGGYIAICLSLLPTLARKINTSFILVITVGIIGVFISFSRTAIVALIIFLISFFLISVYEKYKKGKLNQVLVKQNMFIIMVLVLTASLFSFNQFSERFNIEFQNESVIYRTKLLNQSLEMIQQNPFLGVGINNFFNNLDKTFNSPSLLQPVHNIFLLTFSELGIIGFLCLIFILFKSFKKNAFNLIVILTIIILGSFDHYLLTIQQGQLMLTIAISLLLSVKLSDKID